MRNNVFQIWWLSNSLSPNWMFVRGVLSECYFSKSVEPLGFEKLFNYVGFAAAAYFLFNGHRLGHCSTCDGQGEAAG